MNIRNLLFGAALLACASTVLAGEADLSDEAGLPLDPDELVEPLTQEQWEAMEQDPERAHRLLPAPEACNEDWRCPDPMKLDSQEISTGGWFEPPEPEAPEPAVEQAAPGGVVRSKVRIGRGFRAPPGSAPWMAQIQRPALMPQVTSRMLDWEDRQECGGALIAPGWIVTAAHCLQDLGGNIQAQGYRVRMGASDISGGQAGATYRITKVIPHPQYVGNGNYYNDIALIRFAPDEQTERSRRIWVQAVAIDASGPQTGVHSGKTAFFYGWGQTEQQRPSAPLLYGKVQVQPDAGCNRANIALCAKGFGASGSTQCHGDSGGPLILYNEGTPILIGVVSHNVERAACGQQTKPGVFTRAASFRGWIESHTGRLPIAPDNRRAAQ